MLVVSAVTALVVILLIPQVIQAEAKRCSIEKETIYPALVVEVTPATVKSPPPVDACTCIYMGKNRQHTSLIHRKYRGGIDIRGCAEACVKAFLSSSSNQTGKSVSRCTDYSNWTKY